jgi:hypothetical protein
MATRTATTLPKAGVVRAPVRQWLLTVLTLGVYGVVRHYVVNRELRDFGVDVRPAASALAMFPGALVVVPPFVTLWRTADRIGVAQETAGLVPSTSGPLAAVSIVLWLFVPYHQHQLNLVWRTE